VADETVRRYYKQDFSSRLRQMFAPQNFVGKTGAPGRNFTERSLDTRAFGRRFGDQSRLAGAVGARGLAEAPYVAFSPQLASSPVHRGHRAAIPRREALILQAAINHPWLLHEHLEELAGAEFRHADTQKLKSALIDVFAHHFAEDLAKQAGESGPDAERAALAGELTRRGFADLLKRTERTITTPSVWGARAEAAASDVLLTWKQLIALHRQWHSLTRELKDAETALGQDNTEANYARLRDVKARLTSLEGTEALIEGFGASSGRPVRSL
jgi:DNA primase